MKETTEVIIISALLLVEKCPADKKHLMSPELLKMISRQLLTLSICIIIITVWKSCRLNTTLFVIVIKQMILRCQSFCYFFEEIHFANM